MRKTRHTKRGMTIIEIMVVLSVFIILSAITFGAMRAYDVSTTMSITKSRLSAQANTALNRMRDELSESRASLVDVIIDNPSGSDPSTPDTLSFQIPTGLDGEQNIIWGDGITAGQRLEYYIDSAATITPENQLKRKLVIPATETTLAYYISDLQFVVPVGGNSAIINIVASRSAQRGYIPALSIDLSTQVDFRN